MINSNRKCKMVMAVSVLCICLNSNVCSAGEFLNDIKQITSDVTKDIAVESISDLIGIDFNAIRDETIGKWDSLKQDFQGEITETVIDTICVDALNWFNITDENAAEQLRNVYFTLTDLIGMDTETSENSWESIADFAIENDIDTVVATKLAVATVVRTTMDDGFAKDKADECIKDNVSNWIINSVTDDESAREELADMIDIISERISD